MRAWTHGIEPSKVCVDGGCECDGVTCWPNNRDVRRPRCVLHIKVSAVILRIVVGNSVPDQTGCGRKTTQKNLPSRPLSLPYVTSCHPGRPQPQCPPSVPFSTSTIEIRSGLGPRAHLCAENATPDLTRCLGGFAAQCSYYQSGMSDSVALYLDENGMLLLHGPLALPTALNL
jgi:hypothetical protein